MAQQNRLGTRYTTCRRTPNGTISVVYHSTEVVHVEPDGTVTLDCGGWRTNTTKTRMNQAANQFGLGYMVHQKDFEWFVRVLGADQEWKNATTIPFNEYTVTFKPGCAA